MGVEAGLPASDAKKGVVSWVGLAECCDGFLDGRGSQKRVGAVCLEENIAVELGDGVPKYVVHGDLASPQVFGAFKNRDTWKLAPGPISDFWAIGIDHDLINGWAIEQGADNVGKQGASSKASEVFVWNTFATVAHRHESDDAF